MELGGGRPVAGGCGRQARHFGREAWLVRVARGLLLLPRNALLERVGGARVGGSARGLRAALRAIVSGAPPVGRRGCGCGGRRLALLLCGAHRPTTLRPLLLGLARARRRAYLALGPAPRRICRRRIFGVLLVLVLGVCLSACLLVGCLVVASGLQRAGRPLVALAAPQEAAVVEHVLGLRVQTPVAALARVAGLSGELDEAVVERQIVSDGVLPQRVLVAIVGKAGPDEVADAGQGGAPLLRLEDGHCDERDVRVGWLLVLAPSPLVRLHGRNLFLLLSGPLFNLLSVLAGLAGFA